MDDDADSLNALELLLEPLGVQLIKATSGEQALRILSSQDGFALILMDVRMTGMDGYETTSLIHRNERTRGIPIILLTSFPQGEEEVETGYAHGAVDYLQKPFPANVLRWKVVSFIELFQSRMQVPPSTEWRHPREFSPRESRSEAPAAEPQIPTRTSTLAKPSTVDQILRALFEQALPRQGGGAVSLYLLDESSKLLELVQALGYSAELMNKWRQVSMSWHLPLTDAVRAGQAQWLPSPRDWLESHSSSHVLSPVHAAALPLRIDDRVLGVLGLSFSQKRDLSTDEQALFTAIAHSCAQAISREWVEEEFLEEQQTRGAGLRLRMLADFSHSLRMVGQDLSSLFTTITTEVVRHMGDAGGLWLLSEENQQLECVSLRHVNAVAQEELSQGMRTPPGRQSEMHLRTARTGQPVFMPVVSQEELLAQALPDHRALLERYPLHSWMQVPLRANGRIIGTLDAVRHTPGWPFTTEDLQLLEEFATIAAMAIESVRTFQQQPVQAALRHQLDFEQKLIGIVSHDLRTPLGAIVTAAGLLQATPGLDVRQRKAVHRILSSSERAAHLIRDVLDFTQAHLGGGIPLKCRPMNLHDVVRETVGEVLESFPGQQVFVETDGDGQGQWDPDRLAQVVTNLVSNALARSAPGAPVRVWLSGEQGAVRLEVHNHGTPISSEMLPRIFHPLTRGEQSTRDRGRHIGLGLYIVREIVHGHGGTIEVTSSLERGTSFTVSLPQR